MKELETRKYSFEVRAEQDEKHGNIITGVPIVYEKETVIAGCFREIIHKGALDKADLTDVRFLVNHNLNGIPLARSRKNTENSTMKLTVGDNGLNIRAVSYTHLLIKLLSVKVEACCYLGMAQVQIAEL